MEGRYRYNFVAGGVFMDSSKAFDFILYDLLITKLEVYGFYDYPLHYLYSYLDDRRQCVYINNEISRSQNIRCTSRLYSRAYFI